MADYKEQIATGKSWQRCHRLVIENPMGSIGKVIMYEERVIDLEGTKVSNQVSFCEKTFDPITGTITLLNPETNEPTGQVVTHLELYNILYSLYIQTALARDSAT
jgi:hypothetical protein